MFFWVSLAVKMCQVSMAKCRIRCRLCRANGSEAISNDNTKESYFQERLPCKRKRHLSRYDKDDCLTQFDNVMRTRALAVIRAPTKA